MIEVMPEGDALIVIWMKLLILAGCTNDGGFVYFTKDIPYTDQMLAAQFGRPLSTIQLALRTFEQFGMIDLVDDVILVSNWEKYQNVDGMDKIREQTRKRVAKYRENKRVEQCNATSNATVTQGNATDIDIEEDKEEDKNKKINYQKIIDMYNATCVSFPQCRSLSEARKKAIRARLRVYSEDDIKRAFENMERSSFLKGGNQRNWCANFDWIMCDSNMAKVLDGNYQDHKGANGVKLRPDDGKVHVLDKIIGGQQGR